jgi:hypothetical protein
VNLELLQEWSMRKRIPRPLILCAGFSYHEYKLKETKEFDPLSELESFMRLSSLLSELPQAWIMIDPRWINSQGKQIPMNTILQIVMPLISDPP